MNMEGSKWLCKSQNLRQILCWNMILFSFQIKHCSLDLFLIELGECLVMLLVNALNYNLIWEPFLVSSSAKSSQAWEYLRLNLLELFRCSRFSEISFMTVGIDFLTQFDTYLSSLSPWTSPAPTRTQSPGWDCPSVRGCLHHSEAKEMFYDWELQCHVYRCYV